MTTYYNFVLDIDESLSYLAANQFLAKLLDNLKTLTGHLSFQETFFYKNFRASRHEPHSLDEVVLGAGAATGPLFYLYTTEQVQMRLLLSGLMGKLNRANNP